jgi:hypothetical protein
MHEKTRKPGPETLLAQSDAIAGTGFDDFKASAAPTAPPPPMTSTAAATSTGCCLATRLARAIAALGANARRRRCPAATLCSVEVIASSYMPPRSCSTVLVPRSGAFCATLAPESFHPGRFQRPTIRIATDEATDAMMPINKTVRECTASATITKTRRTAHMTPSRQSPRRAVGVRLRPRVTPSRFLSGRIAEHPPADPTGV